MLGYRPHESVNREALGYVGALVIVEVWRELTTIRRIITEALKAPRG